MIDSKGGEFQEGSENYNMLHEEQGRWPSRSPLIWQRNENGLIQSYYYSDVRTLVDNIHVRNVDCLLENHHHDEAGTKPSQLFKLPQR